MHNQEMQNSQYSLRWNNHQRHILSAFEALLQAETLVDVTLVCEEISVRAHKVVLSACSPFFQRIFSENPCKHPVIVLKDFSGWEIHALIEFMYKGEISVGEEQIPSLIKAADSLQIRGLATDPTLFGIHKENTSIMNSSTPTTSPNNYERNCYPHPRLPTPGTTARSSTDRISPAVLGSPFSPSSVGTYESPLKVPHMSRISFPESILLRQDCYSPIPRRKQARPRRRSGDACSAQDLSFAAPKPSSDEEMAENLCMKKPEVKPVVKNEENAKETRSDSSRTPEMDLSTKEYRTSPITMQQPPMNLKQEIENHSPLSFPPMPSISALAMTPPHSKFFGLDSPLGLFPSNLEGCRNPLFDISDHRTPDAQMFSKKKMGRPKGQHSAPRGGPPRSWTNAELTEALQHVWNKKMTTSQASRIFGIPYNSLLMYVRGKYGKSLKLEQLRKDCIGGPTTPVDMMNLGQSNNNNIPSKSDRENEPIQPNTRPPSTEEQQPPTPAQHFMSMNPFMPNYYPDFGTGFPIPVSMIHLLPQSEKSRELYGNPPQTEVMDCKKEMTEEEQQDMFKPPTLSVEDRRELVQHNGQD
ncbi:hypothetical protein WA026_010944 [Henosepilachna vigintioctopunctata]|uniref:Protein jim lovell n=1 Tax=Henosepilachna vigintioctopunctata TaxID=420089 RepID=A0AAW1UWF8_9CUCU